MDSLTCPLGTPWCTDHEPPDTPDNWAECVRIVGTVAIDHGPATAGFRSDPDDGVAGEVIISVRQIEGGRPAGQRWQGLPDRHGMGGAARLRHRRGPITAR